MSQNYVHVPWLNDLKASDIVVTDFNEETRLALPQEIELYRNLGPACRDELIWFFIFENIASGYFDTARRAERLNVGAVDRRVRLLPPAHELVSVFHFEETKSVVSWWR